MFFEDWSTLGRTAVIGMLAYISVVLFLRLSGKRTLSQKDPFDFVVAAALGSALAQVLLSKEIPLVRGVTGFAVLILLQYLGTFFAVRNGLVRRLIKSEPSLLFYRGEFLRDAMKREHVHEVEILAAVRNEGISALEEVEAVVLEASSRFSVIPRSDGAKPASSLADVTVPDRLRA